MSTPRDEGLVRAIGARRLTASIVNVTVGAGIFALPGLVAVELGAAAPLAYIVCGAAMALIVTCFAAAGSRVSLTGGLYAYTAVAFGPFVGFLAGALYWLAASLAVASVASALIASIAVSWPAVGSGPARAALLALVFGGLALVNVRGVRAGAATVEVVTLAKLGPLLALVAAGLWLLPIAPATWLSSAADSTAASVGRAAMLLIFAFLGIEVALAPGGEVRHPSRTVPRAIFAALAITTLLYLLIQAVAQAILGDELSQHLDAPLVEAAARLFGDPGRLLVLAGAAISMFGYISGDMLGTPRSLFAFARDGLLPARVGAIHRRFHTPWMAILVHAAIVCAMAITSTFAQLAVLTNVVTLSLYFLCVCAAYELQRRDVRTAGTPFRLPGGPLVPALAAAVILWLLSHATRAEFAAGAGMLALATAVYVGRRTLKPARVQSADGPHEPA